MRKSHNIYKHLSQVTRELHEKQNGHKSALLWFTGLSGSGKSTLACAVEAKLHSLSCHTVMLGGDNVRHALCADLNFDDIDRTENTRRIAEVSKLMVDAGLITVAAFISPFRKDRNRVRQILGGENFIEIYVKCPINRCEQRDVKGLYRQARLGRIKDFTGIDSSYEAPLIPELIIDTSIKTINESVDHVLEMLRKKSIIQVS